MKVTYYGHSCFLVETDGQRLLFDPYITPNPLASHIDIDKIKTDYIFVSHGHEDHLADAAAIGKKNDATLVSGFEVCTWLEKKGIKKTHSMNHGGKWNFPFGEVKMVSAVHSSSFPDGSYAGNPAGFVVKLKEKNFYFAGDTALTYDMKLIGNLQKIDFAFLPIGDNYTMGIDDAILAAGFLRCDQVIGMHYDTFEYIKIDKEQAIAKAANRNIELRLLAIGESISV
jgi:L-ascorbate metabolism protein UlaG (beta-lactamase superfamily)